MLGSISEGEAILPHLQFVGDTIAARLDIGAKHPVLSPPYVSHETADNQARHEPLSVIRIAT